jgi:hypothetical protein
MASEDVHKICISQFPPKNDVRFRVYLQLFVGSCLIYVICVVFFVLVVFVQFLCRFISYYRSTVWIVTRPHASATLADLGYPAYLVLTTCFQSFDLERA